MMQKHNRLAAIALVAIIGVIAGACGEDDTSTTASANTTSQSATGSPATGSAQGGSAQGGSAQGGSAAGGTGQGGAGVGGFGGMGALGCVENPNLCKPNEECCQGNPYPPEGICLPMCTMDSDRNAKHDITPVDSDAVLERLAALPVARWRYDATPASQHMGPMAQDFRAAFGLGDSDRHIATVDANGVMMAALQALHRRQAASERENAALRAEIAALRAELERR